MIKPPRISENDNDDEAKGYEDESSESEDLEGGVEDSAWGVATTMSW